jgi:protein-disulfide isomerase
MSPVYGRSVVGLALLWTTIIATVASEIVPPFPVRNTEPGIRYNPFEPRPKVKLSIYVDLNCPYSNAALPVVKNVSNYYGNSKLDLVVQQLPLPYHRNAFLCTQGLYVIRDQVPARVFNYMEAVLARNSDFSTSATVNLTETQVLSMLADIAVQSTGIDRNLFTSLIGNYRAETTAVWKYATSSAKAWTPTYVVNGIQLGGVEPTFDEWIAFLDPIVNG